MEHDSRKEKQDCKIRANFETLITEVEEDFKQVYPIFYALFLNKNMNQMVLVFIVLMLD